MKKTLILSLIIIFSSATLFGQKCKPYKKVEDKITDETTHLWGNRIDSKDTTFSLDGRGHNVFFSVAIDSKSNQPYAVLQIENIASKEDADIYDVNFEKESEYVIKTDKGVVNFTIAKIKKNKQKVLKNLYIINQLIAFPSQENLETLASGNFEYFRVVNSDGVTVEGKINKRLAKKIKAQLNCFLKNK